MKEENFYAGDVENEELIKSLREEEVFKERVLRIKSLIPKDVKTILDIGVSKNDFFNKLGYKTITLDLKDADINQDLNKNQKLELKDNLVDLIVFSHILEHLTKFDELISEAKRVSKKYILIGLPNEVYIRGRVDFLKGKPHYYEGYCPYGHKHNFTLKSSEKLIIDFFGNYKKKTLFTGIIFAKKIPTKYLKKKVCDLFPSLFVREVYYLIKLRKQEMK